jgi:hypothetical protein
MTSTYAARQVDDATTEQLLRWKAIDWEPTNYYRATELDEQLRGAVITAARAGTRDEFAQALGQLVNAWGKWNGAYFMSNALHGDQLAVEAALESNPDLQALHRTVAERAGGRDVAEVATSNGLRLRAEQTGEAYETAVLVEDTPGRSDVLASGTVVASSATEALRFAAEREHAVHGLDRTDLGLIERQLARLEQLTGPNHDSPGPENTEPGADRWAGVVLTATGQDLRAEQGWAALVATLERAASAGWDVQQQLPTVASAAPLLAHGSSSHELAYRVMDACPAAVPPAPSVAQINGTEPTPTGRQREAADRAIARAPATDRAPTVGR